MFRSFQQNRRVILGFASVTLASVALRWMVPINPTGIELGAFDQGLYERLAASILRGEWLGEFTKTTLAKGPGYSIFLALSARLHLPLSVAHQLSFLAGALAVSGSVFLVTKRARYALLAYAFLAFDPTNFNSLSTAVTRENAYTGFALLFVVGFFVAVQGGIRRWRWPWLVALGVATGIGGAFFWLCREEGIWVVPSLGLIAAGSVALFAWRWWPTRRRPDARGIATGAAAGLAVAAVCVAGSFVLPIREVHQRNADHYGVGLTTDFASGTFPAAFSSWSRVRGVGLRQYVPINEAQRRAVYRVSPAARELEPFLEAPTNGWKQWACPADPNTAIRGATHINICDDFPGGAAAWAFRDAALQAGHYDNAIDFQAFFARVDEQIRAACDDGRLRCSRALPAGTQFAERAAPGPVARSTIKWVRELVVGSGVFDLYGPHRVNEIPASERPEIKLAVRGTADSQREAIRDAARYHDRRYPHLVLGWIYRFLGPLVLLAALVRLIGGLARRWTLSSEALLLVAALVGAAAVRLVMFGVIDTTQYFNEMRYQLSTRAFLFAAAAVVLAAPTMRIGASAKKSDAASARS